MVEFKANPRDEGYLRELFAQRYPDGRIVALPREAAGADRVVLLYADAIGLGWGPVERAVRRAAPDAELRVLNGRRRDFALDRATRRRLAVRRAAESSLAGEALMTVAFVAATPVLLAIDLLRGRR
jgi:hypothetical protein